MNTNFESSPREEVLTFLRAEREGEVDLVLELVSQLAWDIQSDPRLGTSIFPGWFLLEETPQDIMQVLVGPPPFPFLDCEDFLPPEYLKKGGLDERSVVFALGITAFKLLTGNQAPYNWRGTSMVASMRTWMEGIVRPISELRPDCPPEVAEVFERAYRRNPSERQQSVAELLRGIQSVKR